MDQLNKTVFVNTEIENGSTENLEVKNMENDGLDQLYLELGKAYYEGAFEDPLPQLLPIFDKITMALKPAQEQADAIARDIETGSPAFQHICRGCGAEIPDYVFDKIAIEQRKSQDETEVIAWDSGMDSSAFQNTCGGCGAPIPDQARFCAVCGMPAEAGNSASAGRRICGRCGSALDEGARFCGNCGTPVS